MGFQVDLSISLMNISLSNFLRETLLVFSHTLINVCAVDGKKNQVLRVSTAYGMVG